MQEAMGRIPSRVHYDQALGPLYVQVEQPYAVGTAQGRSNGRTLPLLQPLQLGRQSGETTTRGKKTYGTSEGPSTRESVS